MQKQNRIFSISALLAIASPIGCAAFGPIPPSQAHLDKAGGKPVVALGDPATAKAATCRTQDAAMNGSGTLGTKIDLRLICRSDGGEPAWNVHVLATCTAISAAGSSCLETGTWTLRWTGRADIDRDEQELGTSEHTAAAFQAFLKTLGPQPKPEASADTAPKPR